MGNEHAMHIYLIFGGNKCVHIKFDFSFTVNQHLCIYRLGHNIYINTLFQYAYFAML